MKDLGRVSGSSMLPTLIFYKYSVQRSCTKELLAQTELQGRRKSLFFVIVQSSNQTREQLTSPATTPPAVPTDIWM